MDLLSNLVLGFSVAMTPDNLLFCFLGALLGTIIGVLPGIGPIATIAMLLPLTFGLTPEASLIMLAGIYYGSQYGGSTTAILVNMPGEASSVVTTIDGYQMARRGQAGPALVAAGLGSFVAGTFATILIALVAKPLTWVALSFGAPEYFALLTVGLISSIALASGSAIKALGMICLGLLLGLTGTDIYTGMPRFTFGITELSDGLEFAAVAVGLFGIGEILRNLESSGSGPAISQVGSMWPTRNELVRIAGPVARGSVLGSVLGILPGGGALLAAFAAYNLEKKVSRFRHEMGQGAIEGVAAPEAANNAAAQTSFIPMLSLGIPANVSMALMIGAMMIHGLAPGPNIVTTKPGLFWGIVASMWIGNAMLLILNVPLVGIWISLLRVPYRYLYLAVVAFCCIGVYSFSNSSLTVLIVAAAGLAGYGFVKLDCELAPFVLGFVLGPLLEEYLRRALIISDGDPTVFFTRPISGTLMALAVAILIVVTLPAVTRKRKTVFVEKA
ncbi:MAG: tripartite tricarboxylate transporter permease [Alphaproteobacteria bacterium]